ncbi:hypothetical protein KAR91_58475 [Candidatus Pacearchaeota archaeon]|nr:hypothetical protein [Candidatus Pacearchaeota archaeon]
MNFDWKGTLSKVAPMLGTAVGGPFGGMAASAALKLLDIEPEKGGEEEQLAEAMVSISPEQAVKLQMAEKEWKATMKELNLKEEDLHAKDRASARDMAAKTGIKPQVILSVLYTVGYIVVLYMFLSGGVDIAESIKAEFNMLLGVLTTCQVQIMNFWFGSSSGSKDKTHKLNK